MELAVDWPITLLRLVMTTGAVALPSENSCDPRLTARKSAPDAPNSTVPASSVRMPAVPVGALASGPRSAPTCTLPDNE